MKHPGRVLICVLLSSSLSMFTCGCLEDADLDLNACLDVDCGPYGRCVSQGSQASCECAAGYHADGLTCVKDSGTPCDGVDCGDHGSCAVQDNQATCDCDSGYHADGLNCVADAGGPCDGVDCGAHGSCVVNGDQAECDCDSGYHADGLTCVEDGGPAATFCQEACGTSDDCKIGGQDLGYTCNASSRCQGSSAGCTGDPECVALFAGWSTSCTNGGGECDAMMQSCIDIGGGAGRCATPPGALTCEQMTMTEIQMPAIDGSGNVAVCILPGVDDALCRDGFCFNPCGADGDCQYYPGQPHCDNGSGECVCTGDPDCASVTGYPKCNTTTGKCMCENNVDCESLPNADTCYDGVCGCSSVSICTSDKAFDGTTWVCE